MVKKNTNDQENNPPGGEEDGKDKSSESKGGGSGGVGGIFEDKESYTKDEVTTGLGQVVTSYEAQIKIFKDRLSTVGLENAKLKGFEKQVESADEMIAKLVKESGERETATGKGDADALSWVQRGWGNRTLSIELAKTKRILDGERTELNLIQAEVQKGRLTQDAETVAKEHGVDAELLISLAPDGGEKMTEVAKTLSQHKVVIGAAKAKDGKDGDGNGGGVKRMLKLSGKGEGGNETPSGREAIQSVIKKAKQRSGVSV